MAKNAINVMVRVIDKNYLPGEDRVMAWFEEQWRQAMRQADETQDGTVIAIKSSFPMAEIPKE